MSEMRSIFLINVCLANIVFRVLAKGVLPVSKFRSVSALTRSLSLRVKMFTLSLLTYGNAPSGCIRAGTLVETTCLCITERRKTFLLTLVTNVKTQKHVNKLKTYNTCIKKLLKCK